MTVFRRPSIFCGNPLAPAIVVQIRVQTQEGVRFPALPDRWTRLLSIPDYRHWNSLHKRLFDNGITRHKTNGIVYLWHSGTIPWSNPWVSRSYKVPFPPKLCNPFPFPSVPFCFSRRFGFISWFVGLLIKCSRRRRYLTSLSTAPLKTSPPPLSRDPVPCLLPCFPLSLYPWSLVETWHVVPCIRQNSLRTGFITRQNPLIG